MAQVCLGQSNLRKALLRVPRPAVGARNVYDMLRTNLVKMLPRIHSVLVGPMSQSAIFEQHISCCAHDIHTMSLGLLMKYFNTHPPFQCDEALLSGSWSEGLTMHQVKFDTPVMSDMDFMCILKNISFSEEDQACDNLTVKEDTPFVNAYLSDPELLKMWEEFLEDPAEDTTRRQLSSRKLKATLHENYKKKGNFFYGDSEICENIGDGPSLELKKEVNFDPNNPCESMVNIFCYQMIASSDIILCIRCDGWPRCAWEWLQRDRLWPDKNLVQKISQNGFHIVPKSSPEGNFRLSFSNAETTLIEYLTPLQHKVIRAFKAVIKYHQSNWSPNVKDIICTYHLKTIAFWHVEKTTQDSWTEDNVVSHLLSLIEEFGHALRKGSLPMYFLPKYNLLKNVENCEEMKNISDKVVALSRDIPAITTAVNKMANVTLGDATFSECLCCILELIEREIPMKDNMSWKMFWEPVLKLLDGDAMELVELELPKDMADNYTSFVNILDTLFYWFEQSKKENETSISLD